MPGPATIFQYLQGEWLLERRTNGHGQMQGRASFSALDNAEQSLHYREQGQHVTAMGRACSFFKEYLYTLDQGSIVVYFCASAIKGGLFYPLCFAEDGSSATGKHLCAQDLYEASYQFVNANEFILHYQITGPRKNLLIQTQFQRA